MNDIHFSRQPLESVRHNLVVKGHGAKHTQQAVGQAQLPSCQGRTNSNPGGKGPGESAGKNQQVCSCGSQAAHLLPSRITNAVRAQSVGKAVEHPHAIAVIAHSLLSKQSRQVVCLLSPVTTPMRGPSLSWKPILQLDQEWKGEGNLEEFRPLLPPAAWPQK